MRCSAYEGCQEHSGHHLVFLFFKSFFSFSFPGFSSSFVSVRRARASLFVSGLVPVTSSYSSIALGEPMMSCLTWGSRRGGTRPI